MNRPAPPADSTVMARLTSTSPSLSSLPVEMLDKIFQSVDNSDLINLRLVSKHICAVASRPFAVRNFTSRYHVLTQDSLEALLAISTHGVFGTYIKRIVFCPAQTILRYLEPYDEEDESTVVESSFVQSGRFSVLMQHILANIRRHSSSITVGVSEDSRLGHGPHDFKFANHRAQRYHGEGVFDGSDYGTAYRTSETLELVLVEMLTAGIDIRGLELIWAYRNSKYATKLKTYNVAAEFLKSRDASINLCFEWIHNGVLEYNHMQKRLHFSSSSLFMDAEARRPDALFVEETVRWLSNTSFSDLHLEDLDVDFLPYLDAYLKQSLQTITLDDVRLGSVLFAQGLYSEFFQRLSQMPSLKHCRFSRLHYALPYAGGVSRYTMQLTSGRFESEWLSLLLVFPDGKFKLEIRGTDISRELEDLAAYTAAAERRKVCEVEAAGEVTNYRVMGVDAPIFEEKDIEYVLAGAAT